MRLRIKILLFSVLAVLGQQAHATYVNLFNIEGESTLSAQYVTYSSLNDMLQDSNRQGVFTPNAQDAGRNIVGSGTDGTSYWSLFNIEQESVLTAQYVTYNSLADMLLDSNRQGVFTPNSQDAGRNIVGSGTDGASYWSLFNIEQESVLSAQYVTYNSLTDMLLDSNRQGVFTPNSQDAGRNIVGSGTDGAFYWSLFNIEQESVLSAQYVAYNSLTDMLLDSNRQGVFTPDALDASRNIVGSSAELHVSTVPEPGTLSLLMSALLFILLKPRWRKIYS